jgi:hypothetical protein
MPRPALKLDPLDFMALVHVPEVEERVGQAEQSLADPSKALLALGHPLEVAEQMCEADLALIHFDEQVHGVAVRDDEAGGLVTDQFARDLPAPGVPDDEDRGILAKALHRDVLNRHEYDGIIW